MKYFVRVACVAALAAAPAMAQDSVDHYAPQPSETLEQALDNFLEYNAFMAEILAKDSLTPNDMEDVHQLTYTIEAALAKMIAESSALAVQLEIVHHWSEGTNAERLKEHGQTYLEMAQKLVP
jgi:hypothetical protein